MNQESARISRNVVGVGQNQAGLWVLTSSWIWNQPESFEMSLKSVEIRRACGFLLPNKILSPSLPPSPLPLHLLPFSLSSSSLYGKNPLFAYENPTDSIRFRPVQNRPKLGRILARGMVGGNGRNPLISASSDSLFTPKWKGFPRLNKNCSKIIKINNFQLILKDIKSNHV